MNRKASKICKTCEIRITKQFLRLTGEKRKGKKKEKLPAKQELQNSKGARLIIRSIKIITKFNFFLNQQFLTNSVQTSFWDTHQITRTKKHSILYQLMIIIKCRICNFQLYIYVNLFFFFWSKFPTSNNQQKYGGKMN